MIAAIAFVCGFVIGGLLGTIFVYLREVQILNGFRRRIDELEAWYKRELARYELCSVDSKDTADDWCE